MSDYILLTIAHNESIFIEELVKSVKKQTKRPKIWLIVDDGSDDGTWEKIKPHANKWIYTQIKKRNDSEELNHLGKVPSETAKEIIIMAQSINFSINLKKYSKT